MRNNEEGDDEFSIDEMLRPNRLPLSVAVPTDPPLDDMFYDIDRQLMLPANASLMLAQPGVPVDIHYPALAVLATLLVGAVLGVYQSSAEGSGASLTIVPSILGNTTYICFFGKQCLQCLFNKTRKSTIGLSTDAQHFSLLGYNSFLLLLIFNYFNLGLMPASAEMVVTSDIFTSGSYSGSSIQ